MSKVITGNPGVGKHTIAKQIAKNLNLDLIDINKVAIENGIFVRGKETLDVDTKALQKILDKKITNHTLIVGHLAPYVISRNKINTVIVLRKSPYKLIPIYKKRKYSKQKTMENLGSEILGITFYDALKKFGPSKIHQIDTSFSSVSKVAKRIEMLFEKGKFQEDQVDWLGLISKKGDLERFFPY
ncbi:AAA family ATPase [Candidatus Pacearchaeota archaeon]|nr:AAA family ATPase [Candidatus Pacearchaeota archaeon]